MDILQERAFPKQCARFATQSVICIESGLHIGRAGYTFPIHADKQVSDEAVSSSCVDLTAKLFLGNAEISPGICRIVVDCAGVGLGPGAGQKQGNDS
jgi:hypothetical protein